MTVEIAKTLEDRSEFSFRWFAERPIYVNYNNSFVDRTLPVVPNAKIGDIACGTGIISNRIFSHYQKAQQEAEIIGIEPNTAALVDVRQNVPSSQKIRTVFIEGTAADFINFVEPNSLDIAYFCNAIHEISKEEDKLASLVAIYRTLKPCGKLFINSAFTQEMFPDRTMLVQWARLRQRAMEILGKSRDKGKPGFGVYATEYYAALLTSAGFVVKNINKTLVEVDSDDIRAISKYDTYIDGQLMDMQNSEKFTLRQKSDALLQAIDDSEEQLRKTSGDQNAVLRLTRNWVEIEAEKAAA